MPVTDVLAQLKSIESHQGGRGGSREPGTRQGAGRASSSRCLLTQMMQQMKSSMFDSGDSESSNDSAPLADSLFAELSLAISRAGGMGLADSFMGPLMRETSGGQPGAATADCSGRVRFDDGRERSSADGWRDAGRSCCRVAEPGRPDVVGLRLAQGSD
jgi:hypothetical protein